MKRKADPKRKLKADPYERLERELCRVLEGPLLPYEKVIQACGKLSDELLRMLDGGDKEWAERAWGSLGSSGPMAARQGGQIAAWQLLGSPAEVEGARLAAGQISRAVLSARVRRELGEDPAAERRRFPLGVLFHLGAGNVAGLGAYSVIEGLLAGNVNLLKPSGTDKGISAFLLKELVRLEPELKPYIHIFPISSDRQKAIGRLAKMADGVAIWGSDETVRKVRAIVGPDKKLIEWGHRFSFVYCTEQGLKDKEKVRELAGHILRTQQRFCSSCQAVFLDTERQEAAEAAVRLLRGEIRRLQAELGWDVGQIAQMTLREHTFWLEDALTAGLSGRGSGRESSADRYTDAYSDVTGHRSMAGDPEDLAGIRQRAGGCPVCCLPRHRMLWGLRRVPLSLQTAGLICQEGEWEELSYLLLKAGAVRVKRPGQMEETGYHGPAEDTGERAGKGPGEPAESAGGWAHDGEYPLLRYTKVVER